MSERILVVDDEQPLLNGLRRRLGGYYDLTTANSGPAALAELKSGSFAVVMTDMRMPGMDGVQFIQQARMIAPDAVYMMLTGNQDQATAIKAVNDGQVFRLLNKPCEHDNVRQALDAGLAQYRLITTERALLNETLPGAVGVLTDVLRTVHPDALSRVREIEVLVNDLRQAIGAPARWEFKLAAHLGLLGFALLPEDQQRSLRSAEHEDFDLQTILAEGAATGAQRLENIPRLEVVANIVREQMNADGDCIVPSDPQEQDIVAIGATLLRIAVLWSFLTRLEIDSQDALAEVRRVLPNLNPAFEQQLEQASSSNHNLSPVGIGID
ncbi:response regulator [Aeoliella sp.]|uniref:response regulator n=1 Tax=Aeoliella sp. TaxID=2795800 RepID=UPI003CCC289A